MSLYALAVFLHITGALGLFAAIGVEWAGLSGLRSAVTVRQARDAMKILGATGRIVGPAMLTLLISGIFLVATRWGAEGWIAVGFGGMILMGMLGGGLSARRAAAVAGALPAVDGTIAADVRTQLRDPVLLASALVRRFLALGVVFVMSTKPGAGGALTALAVALLVAAAASLVATRESATSARHVAQ